MKMKLLASIMLALSTTAAIAQDKCDFGAVQPDGSFTRLTAEEVYQAGSRPAACVSEATAVGIAADLNARGKLAPGTAAMVHVVNGSYVVIVVNAS